MKPFQSHLIVSVILGGLVVSAPGQTCSPTYRGRVNGTVQTESVYVKGDWAYVASQQLGLQIVDVSDPMNPQYETNVFGTTDAWDVFVHGNYAYVATWQNGLQVVDVSTPDSPFFIGDVSGTVQTNGVVVQGNWAYVASQQLGLQVLDVSNPAIPVLVTNAPGTVDGRGIFVDGNYAYLATWQAGLQILDISDPTDPQFVTNAPGIVQANGVFVKDGWAYVASEFWGLQIVDVSDPTAPVFEDNVSGTLQGRDIYVEGDWAYLASEQLGLQYVDVSDPANAVYGDDVFETEQGRGVFASCLKSTVFLASEQLGLQVVDISTDCGCPLVVHHNLTVTVVGSGQVSAIGQPGILQCSPNGGICQSKLPAGTIVTLVPTPDQYSTFVEWSGDCVYGVVTMDADKACTATFKCIYGGGTGTAGNPYKIQNPVQMNLIGLNKLDWASHFTLLADIDMSSITGTDWNIIGHQIAIGQDKPFTGTFAGNGHTISDFTYTKSDVEASIVGMFGQLGAGGVIDDLHIEDANVIADHYAGLLAARVMEGGEITGCTVQGCVTAIDTVGGLVGENLGGTLTNCHTDVEVNARNSVGGLVGKNGSYDQEIYATISNCSAAGDVSGDDNVGGLIGQLNKGTIIHCRASGQVTGAGYKIGGLVGTIAGYGNEEKVSISYCRASGDVSGAYGMIGGFMGSCGADLYACCATGNVEGTTEDIGGLLGIQGYKASTTNCYSTGNVTGMTNVGGLIGRQTNWSSHGLLTNCYAAGTVSGTTDVGSLVGHDEYQWADYENCFYDNTINPGLTGIGNYSSDPSNVRGRHWCAMKSRQTFTDYGWDFVGETDNGTDDIWQMCMDGKDVPRLAIEYDWGYTCRQTENLDDLLYLSHYWLWTGVDPYTLADRTGDGIVNLGDFAWIAERWMQP